MAQSKHRTLRILSAVLVQSFLLQQLSYAAPSIAPTNVQLFSKPGVSLVLPESIASVEDSMHLSGSDKTLILIQDAHTNSSAQFNIAKAISHILDKDQKTKLVFLEAAEGSDSLSFLRNYSDNNTRTRTASSFVQKGLFNGAEYLDLTSDKDIQLWGVEDKALYIKSLESYKAVAKDREKFLGYLSTVESASEAIKGKLYGPSLQKFDAIRQKFLKEEMTITEYFDALTVWAKNTNTDLSAYPHLKALNALKVKESSINFEKANEEQIQAIASLSDTDQKELAALSQKDKSPFKLSSLNHYDKRGFYTVLKEKLTSSVIARPSKTAEAISAGIAAPLAGLGARNDARVSYPELFKYFDYLNSARQIEAKEVLSEQKHLEDEIYAVLAKSQDEKRLVIASSNIQFLKKLFNLTATPEEFDSYKNNSASFDIKRITGFLNKKIMDRRDLYERLSFLEEGFEDTVRKAEDFYLLTHDRNEAFIKNLTTKMDQENQKSAILITGGFHTPDLKSLLKKNGISYISITPQILHETNLKKYEELLLSQKFADSETKLASLKTNESANAIAAWVGGQDIAVLNQYAAAIGAPANVVALRQAPLDGTRGRQGKAAARLASEAKVTVQYYTPGSVEGKVNGVYASVPKSVVDQGDRAIFLYIREHFSPNAIEGGFWDPALKPSVMRSTGARLSEAPPTDRDEDEAYRRALEGTPRSAAAEAALQAARGEGRLETVEHALEGGVVEIPTVVTTPAPTPSAPGKLTAKEVALEGGIASFPHVARDGDAFTPTPGNINEGARLADGPSTRVFFAAALLSSLLTACETAVRELRAPQARPSAALQAPQIDQMQWTTYINRRDGFESLYGKLDGVSEMGIVAAPKPGQTEYTGLEIEIRRSWDESPYIVKVPTSPVISGRPLVIRIPRSSVPYLGALRLVNSGSIKAADSYLVFEGGRPFDPAKAGMPEGLKPDLNGHSGHSGGGARLASFKEAALVIAVVLGVTGIIFIPAYLQETSAREINASVHDTLERYLTSLDKNVRKLALEDALKKIVKSGKGLETVRQVIAAYLEKETDPALRELAARVDEKAATLMTTGGARLAVSIDMPISADDTTIATRILPGLVGLVTGTEYTGKYKGQNVAVTLSEGSRTFTLDGSVAKALPKFPLDKRASHRTYDAIVKQLSELLAAANARPSAPRNIHVSVTSKLTKTNKQFELLKDVTDILSQGARLSFDAAPRQARGLAQDAQSDGARLAHRIDTDPEFQNPFLHTFLGKGDGNSRLEKAAEAGSFTPEQVRVLRTYADNYSIPFNGTPEGLIGTPFGLRVKHSIARGPGKGGIRFIFAPDLTADEYFMSRFHRLIGMGASLEDLRYFLRAWIQQETQALALGMTIKNAVTNLPYGGAKGSLLFADVFEDGNGGFVIRNLTGDEQKARQALQNDANVRIVDTYAWELYVADKVGAAIDIPAPDVNSGGFMDRMVEQGLRMHYEAMQESGRLGQLPSEFVQGLTQAYSASNGGLLPYVTAYLKNLRESGRAVPPSVGPFVDALATFTAKSMENGGAQFRNEATGYGVVYVLSRVLALQGQTVKVHGFGNVAKGIIDESINRGAKVIAISDDANGIVHRSEGFTKADIEVLNRIQRENKGSLTALNTRPEYTIAGSELLRDEKSFLELDADIFTPALRENAITGENARFLKARVIAEGANGPLTNEAYQILTAKGVTVIPDSVANVGGVTVSMYEWEANLANRLDTFEQNKARLEKDLADAVAGIQQVQKELNTDFRTATDVYALRKVLAASAVAKVGGTQESALSLDDERPSDVPSTVRPAPSVSAETPSVLPDGNKGTTFLVGGARLASIKLALEKGWVIANHIMISIHAAFISSLLSLPDNISNKWDVLKFVFTSLETPISILFAYTSFHVGVWWHERGHYIESVKTLKLNKELLDDARKHVEMPFFKRLGWELKLFALAPLGKFEGIQRHGVGYAVKARYNMSSAAAGPLASGKLAKVFLPLSAVFITLGLATANPALVLLGRVALGIGAVGLMDRLLADPGEVKKYKDYLANKQPTVTGSSDWESRIPAVREFIMKNRMDSVVTEDGRTVRIPWGYRNSAMGGAHTEKQFPQSNISMQEGMFIPLSAKSIAEAQEMTYALQEKLRTIIDNTQGASVLGVGLEGGLAPYIEREAGDDVPEMRLWRMMLQAITDLKYKPGVDVAIALDPATSELENEYRHKFEQPTAVGQYLFWRDKEQKVMTRDELMALYKKAIAAGIPIVSIEDGFAEDDWDGWALLKRDFNGLRVADDLATTNDETIEKIADQGLADTLLVKSNQIGSLSETLLAMMTALGKGWNLISSHRSQSPIDALEADIALGMDVMAVKIGGGGNAERMHKFIAMQMRKLKEDIRKNPSAKLEIPDAAKRAVQEGDAKAFFDQLVITGIMAFEEPTNSGVPTVGVKIMVGFPGTKYDSIFEFKAATPLGTSAGSGEAIHLTDDTIEKNAVTEKYPQLFKKRSDGTYAFYGKKDKDKEVKQSAIDEINDPELSALWKKSRRFGGKGVLNAVDNVLKTIAPEFIGKKASDLGSVADVDRSLLALELKEAAKRGKDVSDPIAIAKRKGNLGMNAILSVSLALTRFRAAADGVELSDLLRDLASQTMAKTIAAREKKDWKEVLENSDWDELVAGLQKVNAERGEGVTLYSLLRQQLPVYDLSGARLAVEDQAEEVHLTGTAQRADMAAAVIDLLAALSRYQHASIELRSLAQAADVTVANRGVIIAMLNVDPNATLVITAPQEQIAGVIRDTVSALSFVQSRQAPSTASEPVKVSAPILDADGKPIVFLVRGARLAGEDREHRISLDANERAMSSAQTAELAYKDSSFIYTTAPLIDAEVVHAIAEDLDARALLGRGTYQIRSTPLTGLGNRDTKTRYGAEVLSVRTNGRVVAEYVSKEPHRLDEPARSLAASKADRGPRVIYTRSGNGIRSEAPNNNLIVEEKFPDGTQLRDINPDTFTIEEKLQVADAAAALIGGMLADSITKRGVTHAFDGDAHIFVVRQKDGSFAVRMVDWAFPDLKDFSESSAVDAVLQSLLLDRAFGKFGTHFRARFTDKVLEAVSAAKRYAAAAAAGKSRAPVFPAGLEEFPTRGDDYGARLSAAADVRLLEASITPTGLRERPASAFITNETPAAARLASQPAIQNAAIKKLIDSNRESLEALVAYLVKAEEERGFALESEAAVVSTFKLQVTRESGRVVRAALVDSTGTALVTVENPLAVRASKTDAGQGVVTLLRAAEMNASMELTDIAHAPMAHGVPAGALSKFSDERVFNAQARILVQQAVSAHRQSAFSNDRFYLENTEALSASQLAILSELVQKANDAARNEILIIGSADRFTGIVSRYVDADSATSPVQIDAKTFIVPVTGLEEDALVGWVRAFRAGGTIGGILEKHLSDGVIVFDDVKPSDLSAVAALVGIDAASYFRVMSQADRSVAALKRAALNIKIVRIPLEQLLNGAKIALRATGVAA